LHILQSNYQYLIIGYCSDSEEIEINNIDKDKYPVEKISTDPFQKLRENADWLNYFLCGYKAVLSLNKDWAAQVPKPKGLKMLIDSHVPTAAGLSSSSAFTVCAAVVALHANGLTSKMSKGELS
jgi:galactokinase